jgi:hypothetical protein
MLVQYLHLQFTVIVAAAIRRRIKFATVESVARKVAF